MINTIDTMNDKCLTTEESLVFVSDLQDQGFDLEDYEYLVTKYVLQGFLPSTEALRLWRYRNIVTKISEEFDLL